MFQPQKNISELLSIHSFGQEYLDATRGMLGCIELSNANVRVVNDALETLEGLVLPHEEATLLDVEIKPGCTFSIRADAEETICFYLLEGGASVEDKRYAEKSAAWYTGKDSIAITAENAPARLLYFCGHPTCNPEEWEPTYGKVLVAG